MPLYGKLSNGSWVVAEETETEPDPIDGLVDLIPALPSNSSAGYICSASAEHFEAGNGTASAYKAFDRLVTAKWEEAWAAGSGATAQSPHWLRIKTPAPITIKAYTFQIRVGANTLSPKAWALQGWNGTGWDNLHQQSNVLWYNNERKLFFVPGLAAYDDYRVLVTDSIWCEIAEIHFYG